MGIVGDHPEGGIRFDLTRITDEAPWRYEGSAFTSSSEIRLQAVVASDGTVVVDDEAELPSEVAKRAKLLLRTAWKHAQDGQAGESATPPPRRVHRWRAS